MSNQNALPRGLPACRQYIGFRIVPKDDGSGGTNKRPIDPLTGYGLEGYQAGTGWVDAATAWSSPHNTHGIGFVITPGYLVIDLDGCRVGNDWSPLAVELCAAFSGAYVDVTPSQRGLRIICRAAMPEDHKCKFVGGEVYSQRRFVTITGTGARGNAEWEAPKSLVAWLIERFGLAADPMPPAADRDPDAGCLAPADDDELIALMVAQNPNATQRALVALSDGVARATMAQKWNMDEAALGRSFPAVGRTDGLPFDHSAVDLAVMSDLAYWTGHDTERMERLFRRWPGFREWRYSRKRGDLMERALRKSLNNRRFYGDHLAKAVGVVATENREAIPGDFLAYLPKNIYYHRPSGEFWPAQSVDNTVPPVPVGHNSGGMPLTIKASKFIAQHHYINQVSWWPGMPEIIHDYVIRNGELLLRPGVRVLNLYEHPAPPAGNAHDCRPWLDHIAKLYPNDWGTIIRWMAFVAQNPAVKVNWAIVLGGAMRIGKDTVLAPLKRAVGAVNYQTVDPEYIVTQPYNDYLQTRVLIINEAKDMGGENRFQFYEKTKPIIAAPPAVHRINPKFGVQCTIPNLNATVIMTNHLTGGLYLPEDDGRHAVFWSEARRGHDGINDDYFTALYAWFDDGGMENCAAYLMGIDVSDFKPKGMPPRTPAFYRMVEGGRSDEQNDLGDVVKLMGDKAFSIPELSMTARVNNYPELAEWLLKKGHRLIGQSLMEAGCVKHINPNERRGRWLMAGRQVNLYRLA